MNEVKNMTPRRTTLFAGLVLVFAGSVVSIANAQQSPGPTTVVQLTGLAGGVKDNAKGNPECGKQEPTFRPRQKQSPDVEYHFD